MGYMTREIEGGSTAFTSIYPTFYKELQIFNWTPVDIVITDHTGRQTDMPKNPNRGCAHTTVEIDVRETCGLRTKEVNRRKTEIPIPAKKYTVNYVSFISYPVKIEDLGLIISTREQALIAKNLVIESGYNPDSTESLADYETKDPRFVFEVRDPFNRWENLYVNVMGQTITLRCGHAGQVITDLDETQVKSLAETCTLSCFIRYPSNYVQDIDDRTVPVFTISLKDIDLEEPYVLPSGDVICVAGDLETLQRVIAKKHAGSPGIKIAGMISKEVHDKLIEDLKNQIEAEKQSGVQQLRALRAAKDGEIADLKGKLEAEKRKTSEQEKQLSYWNSLHESTVDRFSREDKLSSQYEKSRQEALENAQKERERFWNTVKIGGGILATVISFSLAILLKTSKK